MNGEMKKNAYRLGKVVLVLMLLCASCTTDVSGEMKSFKVWNPKPMLYEGELVEKWSVDLPKYSEIQGIIRKDFWKVKLDEQYYIVDKSGLTLDESNSGFGLDDELSDARFEHEQYYYLSYYESKDSKKPLMQLDCAYYAATDDYLYVLMDFPGEISKIDLKTFALLWKFENDLDYSELKQSFFVLKDKLALNSYKWITNADGEPDNADTVTIVDQINGVGEVIKLPGNVQCTSYNQDLYLITDWAKMSKYDIENKKFVGKTFNIKDYSTDGSYPTILSQYWFNFETPDIIVNPNTMEIFQQDIEILDTNYMLYNDYQVHSFKKNSKIIGIDPETFKETWIIPMDKLASNTRTLLGDERGILIQSDGKLICFGPP